jgi:hypothetical protein
MIATDTLQALLTQTMLVDARYKSQRNATGERFNIFQILDVQSAEVRTHSAFLAELLKPNGTHGLGGLFLKLFIQSLGIADLDVEGARIEIEKHVGTITEDYLSGGRIDICIFPKSGRPIFIENKIYAADQKYQLLRYHNYDPSAKLIYLTLDGAEPGKHSTGGKVAAESIQAISYSADIIAWLDACRKEAVMQPLVRETITQYINLLKALTGQSTNKLMTEEIKQLLLRSPEHLAGAQNLGNAFNEIRAEVQRAVHEELNSALNRVLKGLVPQPEKNIFMQYRGYDVKFSHDTDGTGYFWGFPAYDQNGKGGICKRTEFDEFISFLRTLDGRFRRSDWWAGWISPPGFTKVENCSAQQLLRLTSIEARQELAAKTAKQAGDCIEKLMQKFGSQ